MLLTKKVVILIFLQILLTFTLFSSEKYKLEIVGLKNIDKNYVLTQILSAETHDNFDTEKATQLLKDSGWFSDIKFEKDEINKIIKIHLTEYPVIKDKIILGSTILDSNLILNQLGIEKGAVFNRTIFYSNLNKLYELYKNKGYTQTEIDKIEISPEGVLKIYILEWSLKEVVIVNGFQNSRNRIINFLLKENGSVYNANLLKKSIETLYYSGLFQNINVKIVRSEEKGNLIAHLEMEKASPEPDFKFRYNSFNGLMTELGFTAKGFMQNLDNFNFKFSGYKLSKEKFYTFESTLNNLIDFSRHVNLDMKIKHEAFSNKQIEGYYAKINIGHYSCETNITMALGKGLASEAGLGIGSYKASFTAGNNREYFYLKPYGRLNYQFINREKREEYSLGLGTELIKPSEGEATLRGELNGRLEFYAKNVRNTLSISAGLSKGNLQYIFNKYRIGANNKSRFLNYDQLFLDNYLFGSLSMQLPYLGHILSPYLFTEYTSGINKNLDIRYSIPALGIGFYLAGLPLDIYIAWGRKSSVGSVVFGLSLNLF